MVRDFRRGTLPHAMTSDYNFMAEVKRLADHLLPITADSRFSDVKASIGAELERQYWNDSNRTSNFLKHADRDGENTISLATIDNELLLLKGVSAYQDVAPDDLGNEGLVLHAYVSAISDEYQSGASSFNSIVALLRKVPTERRREFCYRLVIELNSNVC